MESIEDCKAWLDLLDKITLDYLKNHVSFFEEFVGWTWESYSECIEIHYIGDAWDGKCLSVSLRDLLERAEKGIK